MDPEALRQYFNQKMGNASIPPEKFQSQPYEMYNERGELITVNPLHKLQYEWLGLGSQVALQEQLIAHSENPNLESRYKRLAELERKQAALELLLKAKNLALPSAQAWHHPVLPYGWRETWARLKIAFPRKNVSEMSRGGKTSQTGESKKKVRKWAKISPKPVKIKK